MLRSLIAALCAAPLLAACASSPTVVPGHHAPLPSTATLRPPAELLGLFRPPPGAVAVPGMPAGAPQVVGQPAGMPAGVPQLVQGTSWWLVKGTPQQAAEWFTAHSPEGATDAGDAQGSYQGVVSRGRFLDLPALGGWMDRRLALEAVSYHDGTLLRVDAFEVHVGPRAAKDLVPTNVTRLLVRTGRSGTGPSTPLRTITDPAALRQAVTWTNALPPAPPGTLSCPADTGAVEYVDFFTAASGARPAATVLLGDSGCRVVTLTTLQDPTGVSLGAIQDRDAYQTRMRALR